MSASVIDLGEGFFNIRGSYKLRGLIELGTQCSLVRRASGGYVMLDACGLDEAAARFVDQTTDGGESLEAVLHLHPFHTLSVRAMHERYPRAKLYGTSRHHARFGDLPWQAPRTEDPAIAEVFGADLTFTVPRGVDFVPSNENLHFASVLATHPRSKTMHVDDTLLYLRMPKIVRALKRDTMRFHPTLSRVLERREGAVADFRAWAGELVEQAGRVENLCAAHSATLRAGPDEPSIAARITDALASVESTLRAHEAKHG